MKQNEANWVFHLLGLQLLTVAAYTTPKKITNITEEDLESRRQGQFLPRSRDEKDPQGPLMPTGGGPMDSQGQPMPPGGGPMGFQGQPMPPGGGPMGSQGQHMPPPKSDVGHVNEAVMAAATRFTVPLSTTKKFHRSTPRRVSFTEDCDYLAHYCLKAYDTGVLCGRTLYYRYYTFKNYCLLDYVNCMERYEVWQVVHMGECFVVKELTEYIMYPYDDDLFLDQYYIIEDN